MKTLKTVISVLTTLFCINQSSAALYTISDGGLQNGWNLYIDGNQDGGGNALVGGIRLTEVGNPANTFVSVCTDIKGVVYLGSSYNYVAYPFAGQTGLNPTWGNTPAFAGQAIQNAAYIFDQHKTVLNGNDNAQKAALQMAVWEVLYDTGNQYGYNFYTQGRFQIGNSGQTLNTTTVLNMAMSWITTDLGQNGNKIHAQLNGDLLKPVNPDGSFNVNVQEMLRTTAVPEPSTVLSGLFAAGIIGFSMFRNKL
jgi:hypothetical protein